MAFVPYPSITVSVKPGTIEAFPACTWIVTHKYHGTNFMIRIGQDGSVRYGRRNGYLTEGQKHYNHEDAIKALDFRALAAPLLESDPRPVAVWIYMELYGGVFPGARKTNASVVQKGIYYTNENKVKVFDMFVQESEPAEGSEGTFHGETDGFTGRSSIGYWLAFHDMRERCEAARIPVVRVDFEGSAPDAIQYARDHAADPAHAEPDMPPIEGNAGEGSVVRASIGHLLMKVKNPAWSEISHGKPASEASAAAASGASVELLRLMEFVTPGRVASVFSKEAEDDLVMSHLARLVEAVKADVVADLPEELIASLELDAKLTKAFTSHVFKVVRTALTLVHG